LCSPPSRRSARPPPGGQRNKSHNGDEVPHRADLAALSEGVPAFSAYMLNFANVGIFWNNHVSRCTPRVTS
jgi:hypothetical protein